MLKCDYCGKPNQDVKLMIAGPNGSAICSSCVTTCFSLLIAELDGTRELEYKVKPVVPTELDVSVFNKETNKELEVKLAIAKSLIKRLIKPIKRLRCRDCNCPCCADARYVIPEAEEFIGEVVDE